MNYIETLRQMLKDTLDLHRKETEEIDETQKCPRCGAGNRDDGGLYYRQEWDTHECDDCGWHGSTARLLLINVLSRAARKEA